ncbi:MAG: nickel pincer cofactor biosynthesis protein LarB [Aeoliella sp.]
MNDSPATTRIDDHAVSLDTDRRRRCGYPEVVFGEGKSSQALRAIAEKLLARGESVFATRVDADKAAALVVQFPQARYNEIANTLRIDSAGTEEPVRHGNVAIITAGTSDLPVAEEARETLDWMGVRTTMIHDVGVAGPHRLPSRLAEFENADAVVVVAGMEGALPSVVAGHVAAPVIAVPTSVGYGANFGGVAALLSMLNSCAAHVAVVNIDAGFEAGYMAGLIAQRRT